MTVRVTSPPSRAEAEGERGLHHDHAVEAVRKLLRSSTHGVLSTLSAARGGCPFASLAPYALSREGAPLLLLASMEQHTRDLASDPRASLFVQDPAAERELQACARVTVLGRVQAVAQAELDDARARYLARHPESEAYLAQRDVGLYLQVVNEVRYLGGFGVAGWLPGDAVLRDPAADPLAPHAHAILSHVNRSHREALALLCEERRAPGPATLVGIDMHGLDLRCGAGRLRIELDRPAKTPEEARLRFVALVRAARERCPRGLRVPEAVIGEDQRAEAEMRA